MEDHQGQQQDPNTPSHGTEKTEPVRSRWTPKPEQILILESIFNSGMVNPPKDETVRIRKLLEKFGTVGDANVFYWFQNRRSRSRRRQRLMMQQAATTHQPQSPQLGAIPHDQIISTQTQANNNNNYSNNNNLVVAATAATQSSSTMGFGCSSPCYDLTGSSSSCGGQEGMDGFFSVSSQIGFPEIINHSSGSSAASSVLYPPLDPNFNYHSGYGGNSLSGLITVFINGTATELPKGPINIKTWFGEDLMLVHSSGMPVPTNEFGFLMLSLQHGESYFLVGT
ncbi:hypothetical protein VNO77_16856 [Canavalia gladiata]|uniref:Homeobox domain-containing protein n=1 Tax=Canavalia gladiata TaxID=3824 RepID=A0AAN9QI64_CANGL